MKLKPTILFLPLLALAAVAATNDVTAVGTNAVAAAGKEQKKPAGRPARITAANTYYDRKEGVAIFSGHVHVDDERYQLHAGKAYVFMSGTNDVERIVAVGDIAMTNENKRAYGARVTYYRNRSMVVLHSGDGVTAEVRDVQPDGDRVVRGKKIRFWTDSEQVEVIEADITAPAKLGDAGLKGFR